MKVYPLWKKAEAHLLLDHLHQDMGAFRKIILDDARELTYSELRRKAMKAGSDICPVEACTHNLT
jgi:hypothetical protein